MVLGHNNAYGQMPASPHLPDGFDLGRNGSYLVFRKLRQISSSGVGVVLVEQNVRAALAIANRIYVLVEGRNRLEGERY